MKQKRTATNILIFNLKSTTFASLILFAKLISSSIVTITFSAVLPIEKISNNNDNSINIKDL